MDTQRFSSHGTDPGPSASIGLLLLMALLFAVGAAAAFASPADDGVPLAPSAVPAGETYRMRVENARFGRVEMSVDGGAHYTLVGRVLHPATTFQADRTATVAGLLIRGNAGGLVFSIASDRVLKLRPFKSAASAPPAAKASGRATSFDPSAMFISLEPGQAVFGDLLPPAGSTVRWQAENRAPSDFPDTYTPAQGDAFVLLVSLSAPKLASNASTTPEIQVPAEWKEVVRKVIDVLGRNYAAGALDRAHAENRPVVSGIETLHAKLPTGEPDPIMAVTYVIDGDVVEAQNVAPFAFAWDTRRVAEGEHVVEIRALNGAGNVITSARTLVVVHNTPD